jgi:penicillin-binding protein 1B
MTTAIANLDKSFDGKEFLKKERIRVSKSKYIHKEKTSVRIKGVIKASFFYSLITLAVATVISVCGFFYFYNYYSAIVEHRVASGFWHNRAGIYAAPRALLVNQKISKNETVDLLRRSGYVEKDSPDEIWNGSFTIGDNSIEIKTNNYFGIKAETANIKFSGNKIISINNGTSPLEKYDIEPELLTGRSEAKRSINHALKYEEIPENLRNAILMAEDQRFFEHYGLDPRGIARAFYQNIANYEIKQGGSTITQQLVKNTFLSPEKSFYRKFEEAFLSIALENKMSKQDIFALYCNEIYLGQYGSTGVHGVEQAARAYFDKDLKDLSLTEAAAIAAMIKNPNHYAPHKKETEAKLRREWIIAKMQETGKVSHDEAQTALKAELVLSKPKRGDQIIAPYFVDAATKALTTDFQRDVFNTNYNMRVYTTIDTQLQSIAEQSVDKHLEKLDKIYGKKGLNLQAALVAIDPKSGQILAMVGGRDYRQSQFNRATEAKRQPGSTFKPFVYATALERGRTPMSVFSDRASAFVYDNGKPYKPANYGGLYTNDEITMKTALAKSSNVVAVEVALDSGLSRVARQAEEFGFENIQAYPSMALGTMEVTPLQLAAAYAVFANGGKQVEPTFISKIVSGEDNVIYQSIAGEKQIVSEKTAYMITDMLQAVVERGTARKADGALGKNVVFAGKTGSSKDGWFVGYTPNLVTVAWIGLDDNEDINSTGGEIALPLWTEFMKSAIQIRPEFGGESFPMPKGLVTVEIDPQTGMLAGAYCPHSETVVVPSSASSNIKCLRHQPDLPDTLLAENMETDEVFEKTIVITPTDISVEAPSSEDLDTQYKSIDSVPLTEIERKPAKIKTDSFEPIKRDSQFRNKKHPDSKTYLESYEVQTDGM